MRINTILAALTVAAVEVLSYDADIHPEFQEGLSINDVPADRRLHWMRVANEVSHGSSLVFTDFPRRSTPVDTHVLKLPLDRQS